MNRNWRRIVPATVAIAAAASMTTLTTGSASALAVTFASSLSGVACPSATDCLAVGWSEASGQGTVDFTLGEVWNGKTWAIVPTPTPPNQGGGALLNAISCTSGTDCMAVGETEVFSAKTGRTVPHPLAEAWNGTKWTLSPTPTLTNTGGMLNGVSCTAGAGGGPSRCMAVGSDGFPSHPTHFTLAESWNGSSWTVVTTPMPLTPGGTALKGVSCADSTNCMAVGYYGYNNGFGTSVSLAERWNGTKWSRLVTPTPGSSATFGGVACPAVTECLAVGTHAVPNSPTLGEATFAALWNGHGWKTQPSPNPGAAGGAGLGSISCTGTASCMAAGSWADQLGETTSTLPEQWNGQVWTKLGSPSPRYNNQLNGVACATASSCQAVGDSEGQTGDLVTLGEAWNGTKWSLENTPNP